MIDKFTTLSCKLLESNPYWDYRFDEYVLPSGATGSYYYVQTPGSVMVIPICDDGRIILVRQYRYLNKRFSFEFPGGGMKTNVPEIECARNELREEAGIVSSKLSKIGIFNPFNGVTNEICNVFVAEGLSAVEANPDESEEFDIVYVSKSELSEMIRSNKIWDGMTLSAWSLNIFQNNGVL